MNWNEHLPALILIIPLFGAFIAPVCSLGGKTARNILLVAISFLTLIVAFMLWRHVLANGISYYVMGGDKFNLSLPSGMALPVRIILEVDAFSAFMALCGAIVSFAGALFSVNYMNRFTGMGRFVSLYCLLTAGMIGMMVTGDIFNFFIFIEISSIASFGLIAFWRDKPTAIEASFKYALISQVGSMFILIAAGALYGRYNMLNMAAIGSVLKMGSMEKLVLVFLVGSLAMKCGTFPMHMWLPDAYAEAPTGVTCLLVAVSQASLYGLMRVCFSIYGATMGSSFIPWMLIVFGLASMFFGVSMAVVQHEIKRLMGYHSVSQVGYMLLGLGVGLLVLDDARAMADYGFTAIKGGVFHIFNYTMYKALLFLTAGAIYYATGKKDLNEMGGLARRMPYTTFMFVIAAAAISGLPPFNGFVSKLLIYESSFAVHPFLAVVALVTSVLTLASFVKVFQTAFLGPEKSSLAKVQEVPAAMLIGMVVLTAAILGASLFPSWTLSTLVEPAARALVDQSGYIGAILGGGM
ncbi:MAG: proton-conducting transporter membrane subunit [Synergistaceae bacterium]|jgi:multicomponent Na+:H+ antiporter subunit D|uniref:proton-conducting transporter transmembrane domain-containing protein n=1 Tax=Aminivibrio sp. TaxID=1872489 RepID=UPI0016B89E0D|nr:proton-conducting transporter membrane subunit [Synergistaceae bacterium]MDD3390768.1 proton-conducting transporter membrane subunit [Synergistaceae bacterium]MDD3688483.1 proton-conducting transporter membrane subunit [Synergistaceae bacterium]MDD4020736.1 proton-conducting transporter membrane subunit [Synergistaceae bacterium]MDD4611634.1 proton-conducting transporter membrane subunit [Synergistaceae bacterium]